MLVAELSEKQEFLREMAKGIAESKKDTLAQNIILYGFGTILICLIIGNLIYARRYQIRSRWILLRKKMDGKSTGLPRYSAKVDVTLDVPFAGEKYCRTTTSNLSPGGMFVKMNPPLTLKETFRFRLAIPSGTIDGSAEVVWVQNGWSEHHPTGIGCRFKGVSDEARNRIRSYIQKNKLARLP